MISRLLCTAWRVTRGCGCEQGVEKTILSKMLVEGSNKRSYALDRHAGVVRMLISACAVIRGVFCNAALPRTSSHQHEGTTMCAT